MKTKNRRAFLGLTRNLIGGMLLFNFYPLVDVIAQAKRVTIPVDNKPCRILVVYASYHGSTKQIAQFISQTLQKERFSVDVKSIDEDIDFALYSKTIMGAPIHRGKWMEAAIDFVNSHQRDLNKSLAAYFFTCMAKAKQPPSEDSLAELVSYQATMFELFPELPPACLGVFAGKLDYSKCGFILRWVLKSLMKKNNLEAGDYRNWKEIENWVNRIVKDTLKKCKSLRT